MAIREILTYPHPVLRKRAREVDRMDGELTQLIQDMTETMYHAGGVGLAAPQVGVSKRVIVVDVSPLDPRHSFFVMINPAIISEEGEAEHEEGCLSVPDCLEKVKRREKVKVRGISPEGKDVEVSGEGILSFALQHEIDHLNGVLILDRVSPLKRDVYRRKVKKERRRQEKL
ncbi:MAG: peptide deformylase [Thermodesulfobacteriota bacterium]